MENKGITIIALIVMIAVIIILTSIFVATGIDSLNESKKAEIQNEIYQLKQAVVNRYASYEKNDGNISLIGTSATAKWAEADMCVNDVISTLTFEDETEDEKQLKIGRIANEITRDYDKFVKLVDSDDRISLGLENTSNNLYLVNYYTGSVYGPIK